MSQNQQSSSTYAHTLFKLHRLNLHIAYLFISPTGGETKHVNDGDLKNIPAAGDNAGLTMYCQNPASNDPYHALARIQGRPAHGQCLQTQLDHLDQMMKK
jgi:hypothetical protein